MLNLNTIAPDAVAIIRRNLDEYKAHMATADDLADQMYDESTPDDEVRTLDMMWKMAYAIAKDSKARLARSIAVFSKGLITKEQALEMVSDEKELARIDALLKRFAA
ncbi:MAG: hypothetical protein IJH79_20815 [Lentisphaeria bacterium]|nr:hypothetical protein [Lentisphaeria bacterium]